MEYLNPILARARQVNPSLKIEEIILERKDEIVQKVREQWKKGLRPDGSIIGVYRSSDYRQQKLAQNPEAGGNVDLILTGALNRALTLNKILEATFTIFSNDSKAVMIAEKYGLDVYGLNAEEKEDFLDMVAVQALNDLTNEIYSGQLQLSF